LDELHNEESLIKEESLVLNINNVKIQKSKNRFEGSPINLAKNSKNYENVIYLDNNDNNINTVEIDLKQSRVFNSRSIVTNDFASLYQEYNCSILNFGGKCDIATRKYNLESAIWTQQRTIIINRCDFVALMYKDKRILIMGGKINHSQSDTTITDSIALLNSKDMNINELDFKLKYARSNFGAVYVNYTIYVCGGFNGKEVLNNFEYFDKKTKRWIDLPKMTTRRREFSLIYGPDNCIYAMGGSDEKEYINNNHSNVLKSVDKFDLDKNAWLKAEDMNKSRKGFGAVLMPDGIYVMGGYDGEGYLNSVEKYDFNTKRWRYIEDMNFPKSHFSAVSSLDYQYIYSIGGYDGKALSYIERYDILTNKWEIVDKLPVPNCRHQSIYVNE
jgi:influenza virus NS1A-binding protein